MKREELECPVVDEYYGEGEYERFTDKYYYKDEADKVMDALQKRIKELEHALSNSREYGRQLRKRFNDYRQRINELEADISKMETTQKWISVKDRLPPKNVEFLGCTIKGGVYPCWFLFPEHAIGHLSHWMPLPTPPTTEDSSVTEKEK